MHSHEYYRQEGLQKGFEDAKRTGGKLRQERIDQYLHCETKKLSHTFSKAFIEGWYAGFKDGIEEIELKSIKKDPFWKNHIFWENPTFKDR